MIFNTNSPCKGLLPPLESPCISNRESSELVWSFLHQLWDGIWSLQLNVQSHQDELFQNLLFQHNSASTTQQLLTSNLEARRKPSEVIQSINQSWSIKRNTSHDILVAQWYNSRLCSLHKLLEARTVEYDNLQYEVSITYVPLNWSRFIILGWISND